MSEAAGAEGSDQGLAYAGARYKTAGGANIGVLYQHSFETFNTLYATAEYPIVLNDRATLKTFVQYTDQSSHEDALIGRFDTSMASAKLELQQGPWVWRAAASTTDDEKGIQKPYGNPANYLSVIVEDFDRAGEDAWLLGFSYDFSRIGPGDLSLFANVVSGDTPDTGSSASPDETEYDLTVDYRFQEQWAERLWVRLRAAYIDQDEAVGGNDFFDFRIILNYEFDLL
ncbi:MAG TPA: OprD family outer membrane porin [Wenzhouxiangellaceae bacterium]|nr:OprD family outer membrane porin [Wenzhouxiangellaceae bacterium]